MNIVKEYHDTIERRDSIKKPRSRSYAKLQDRTTELMTKMLQKQNRIDRKAKRA